ncbi:MAG: TfoX/Sxy family protein [Thermomonas sp.]|uniref:TfoX/Sxy family protein n=1 Tax=Thermomonas sp. TaxID=1971895 RepID=UPI0039E66EEC
MATDASFIDYIREQAGLGDRLAARRMFGEYGLYLDGKVLAFACDNSLFLKPTEAGRALLPQASVGPPYPGAKDYLVLDEYLDDGDLLRQALLVTHDALPAAKPRPAKRAGRAAKRPGRGAKA